MCVCGCRCWAISAGVVSRVLAERKWIWIVLPTSCFYQSRPDSRLQERRERERGIDREVGCFDWKVLPIKRQEPAMLLAEVQHPSSFVSQLANASFSF